MMRGSLVITAGAMLLSSTAASAEIARNPAPMDEREQIAGNPWIPWAVALIAALAIALVITDDDDGPQSP